MVVYLDWHIYSYMLRTREENKESLYFNLYDELKKEEYHIPYSPAHLSDLRNAFDKKERLKFINEITNQLCIAQYWNKDFAFFHQRDAVEHEKSIEASQSYSSINDLLNNIKIGDDSIDKLVESLFSMFKLLPHNIDFTALESESEVFSQLFHNAKEENSLFALVDDMVQVLDKINNDYTIYRELRKFIRSGLNISSNLSNIADPIDELDKHLVGSKLNKSFTEIITENNTNSKASKNKSFSLLIDTYLHLDIFGYQLDKLSKKNRYQNMFNDASHCFYGAHCDVLITDEKKGSKKTKAVYEKLGINTKVYTTEEFIDNIESCI